MTAYHADTGAQFDPAALRDLPCMVCGAPIICIGVFCPSTDEARAAVLTLRTHPLRLTERPRLHTAYVRRICCLWRRWKS